jgi:urease accessory protein
MDVITRILGTVENLKGRFQQEDALLLSSEERASPHMLGTTGGGRRVRVSLPREIELNDGDVLALDGDIAVVVRASPERLFIIHPKDAIMGAIAGFQLGNLHRPARFTDDAILTPADPMLADVLVRLDIPYEERSVPFVGRRYGSFSSHRHNDHDHDHHHGH